MVGSKLQPVQLYTAALVTISTLLMGYAGVTTHLIFSELKADVKESKDSISRIKQDVAVQETKINILTGRMEIISRYCNKE